ncbi:hypothetical protein BDV98DRAFT_586713 [Pterulicium gracile]|uniref:Cytochrome P450 n=1 Tax=Pterulicium gracile TaxID=1884261 RepID=A0A5C3Q1Y1_9AGAR|nr:hypothetical protein BDV98DRAFT_586713 [Pterula gracilis]
MATGAHLMPVSTSTSKPVISGIDLLRRKPVPVSPALLYIARSSTFTPHNRACCYTLPITTVPLRPTVYRYDELIATYGEIFHLSALGQHIIVLNTEEAAHELFTRRSAIYSDRPPLAMVDLMNWDINLGDEPADGQSFLPGKIHNYLLRLLADPKNFSGRVERLLGSIVMKVVYNHDMSDDGEDAQFAATIKATRDLGAVILPPTWLVHSLPDFLPFWERVGLRRWRWGAVIMWGDGKADVRESGDDDAEDVCTENAEKKGPSTSQLPRSVRAVHTTFHRAALVVPVGSPLVRSSEFRDGSSFSSKASTQPSCAFAKSTEGPRPLVRLTRR